MISLPTEFDSKMLEEMLPMLEVESSEKIDLKIPLDIATIGFNGFTALVQFVITWQRKRNSGKLILDVTSENYDQLEDFVRRFYGLVFSVFAWDNDIVDASNNSIRAVIRPSNTRLIELLRQNRFKEVFTPRSILFPFFDIIPQGLLPIVYNKEELRSKIEFENITDTIIDIAVKNNKSVSKYFLDIESYLTEIIYEAFDNTNKWATRSYTGQTLDPSVRGIYSHFHELTWDQMSSYANNEPLRNYFQEVKLSNPDSQQVTTFLEVTIFDSGSGLAQRFSGKNISDMSRQEEYDTVRLCLQKHKTSHKEISVAQHRGHGLHRIMELLHAKYGFLSVRSGRMNLYRDFVKIPFQSDRKAAPNYTLIDLSSGSTIPATHPYVDGTVLSMIIPKKK